MSFEKGAITFILFNLLVGLIPTNYFEVTIVACVVFWNYDFRKNCLFTIANYLYIPMRMARERSNYKDPPAETRSRGGGMISLYRYFNILSAIQLIGNFIPCVLPEEALPFTFSQSFVRIVCAFIDLAYSKNTFSFSTTVEFYTNPDIDGIQ